MITIIRRSLWLMLVCGSVLALAASPPVIGVAQCRGTFLINNASVPGTATILDGTSVRTTANSSDVSLKTGERLTLAASSAATVYQDHAVLETGRAEMRYNSAYRLETGELRIGASGTGALVRVAIDGRNLVKVAAITGSAEIRNARGMLIAHVVPGAVLQLRSVADALVHLAGTLHQEGSRFFLTDETTKVRMELTGGNLESLVGKRIQVTGSSISGGAAAAGAPPVVAVTQATTAGATAGGAAAGAAASTGLSFTGAAIVGGVAVSGTVGGLAAAGSFSGGNATVSR